MIDNLNKNKKDTVVGTHFATRVPAHQYPTGTRLLGVQALNRYPGSIFITRVVLFPAGTLVPVYSSKGHAKIE